MRTDMLSPEELLERCNQIRRAGGAPELTELLPGRKKNPRLCLIARNLNFACAVIPPYIRSPEDGLSIAAEALGWRQNPYTFGTREYRLPTDLVVSVAAFDAGDYPTHLYITTLFDKESPQ